ncbi:MAG TPA: thioredoxin family protein [Pirellulaceae bacterium]|nr:thioredoxin family protein [Pirellulaceae bacterium]HMO92467.1 thioredoxin family protein [Pirellulaceae bacterium]HMP67863.1 thioredoxin family protein [Pirellulaceae bacterium]
MNFVTAILLIAATTNANREPLDYATAHELAMKGDKPLLVLVTAEWCPPCQVLKNTVLPDLLSQDAFKDYHFAMVDYDKQNQLAKKLIQNRGVPQLLLYEKHDDTWKLRFLAGAQSRDVVLGFLQNAKTAEGHLTANANGSNNK